MKRACMLLSVFLIVSLFLSLYVPSAKADSDTFYVGGSDDDADQQETSSVSTTGATVNTQSHTVAAGRYHSGFRFPSVTIPQGSTITAAKLSVYLSSVQADDANLKIHAHDTDDAADFSAEGIPEIYDVADRPRTDAFTSWVEDAVHGGVSGWYDSPSILDVVQEIVSRGGWSSSNAIVLLLIANTDVYKQFKANTYDAGSQYAAKLEVTWESAGLQEYTEEFTETISPSASLYLWKALSEKYSETITVTATSYGWKEKTSFYMESTTITEQLNEWIELRRFFTETITITETASFAMELLLEITEFTETIGIDASLFLWKAKQFITQETLSPVANFYDWIELKMTMIEFIDTIEFDAIMILTFEIIAAEVEPSTFGTLGVVIAIIALAIAVTAFAAKTKD